MRFSTMWFVRQAKALNLCSSLEYSGSVKILTEFLSLKGGCTGSSESTLVKMPYYWKTHVAAHMFWL